MTLNELAAATGLTASDLIGIWDAEASGSTEPTQKLTAQQLAAAVKVLADLVGTAELAEKQDKLTFDTTPTTGSNNPVTSGGVADAITQSTASGEIYTVYGTYCTVQKKAGVVYVYGNSSGGLSLTGDADWHPLTTIPSGYRPANTVYFAGASASGKGISFRINASGLLEYVAGTGNTTSYWSYGASYISD